MKERGGGGELRGPVNFFFSRLLVCFGQGRWFLHAQGRLEPASVCPVEGGGGVLALAFGSGFDCDNGLLAGEQDLLGFDHLVGGVLGLIRLLEEAGPPSPCARSGALTWSPRRW